MLQRIWVIYIQVLIIGAEPRTHTYTGTLATSRSIFNYKFTKARRKFFMLDNKVLGKSLLSIE